MSFSRRHSFCGFFMKDCGHSDHSHVLQCERTHDDGYFAHPSVFFKCRAEGSADKMRDVLVNRPALPVQLVEALCGNVKAFMPDEWLQDLSENVEAELLKHACAA
ncbi:hypothetical protein ABL78_8206 [Leptomonas seymouri]|uniref:Uncharacterized protein n=1 Tax=Leptomonas seymouri TaxID=5684 RepID=A0A0N1HRB6_LEPSE|nr:hypothetical protein ABL78_8206 [Leptomonas seymouri]|eukprot:KPI82781.1 hypothetical protein ABL78_8206 [Leptomonas seymouri]